MSGDDTVREIVAAARDHFARHGVHRTRMEDVAQAAGISRQTLYRHVTGREELIELAILERCREFGDAIARDVDLDADDLREEFVGLIVRGIRIGQGDAEFGYLTEALPRPRLTLLISSGAGSPMHDVVFGYFAPLLERGRAEGVLRPDASDHDIVEWVGTIISTFTGREDLDEVGQRRLVRLFVVPALFE